MEFLILSDAHGNRPAIERALQLQVHSPDAVFFLGDGLREFFEVDPALSARFAVAGNCDFFLPLEMGEENRDACFLSFEGHRILLTHGHLFGVKGGYGRLLSYAQSKGADIVLCGHTHVPFLQTIPAGGEIEGARLSRPMYLFNPGSIGRDAEGKGYAFGTLVLKGENVLFSHGWIRPEDL